MNDLDPIAAGRGWRLEDHLPVVAAAVDPGLAQEVQVLGQEVGHGVEVAEGVLPVLRGHGPHVEPQLVLPAQVKAAREVVYFMELQGIAVVVALHVLAPGSHPALGLAFL